MSIFQDELPVAELTAIIIMLQLVTNVTYLIALSFVYLHAEIADSYVIVKQLQPFDMSVI
jgi:hypothetical protein